MSVPEKFHTPFQRIVMALFHFEWTVPNRTPQSRLKGESASSASRQMRRGESLGEELPMSSFVYAAGRRLAASSVRPLLAFVAALAFMGIQPARAVDEPQVVYCDVTT